MKNKLCFILVSILLFFLFITCTNAFTGKLELVCDTYTQKIGDNINCILYGIVDSEISAVESNFVYDTNLVLKDFEVPSFWQGEADNKSLLLYTDVNQKDKFMFATFNVTSSEVGDMKLSFADTYFSDKDFGRNQILNPNYTFKFLSEEDYNKNVPGTDIAPEDDSNDGDNSDNPGTGYFIPVALISGLTILAGCIFIKSRKNKIFH